MKNIFWLFLFVFAVPIISLSEGGSSNLTTTSVQSPFCVRGLSIFANRHGVHYLFLNVNNPDNIEIGVPGVLIDNNVLLAETALTGDDNKLLAIF